MLEASSKSFKNEFGIARTVVRKPWKYKKNYILNLHSKSRSPELKENWNLDYTGQDNGLAVKKKSKNPTVNHLIHFGIYSTASYTAYFSLNSFAFIPSMKNAVLYPLFTLCSPTTTGVEFMTFQFYSWCVSLTSGYSDYSYREGTLKLGKHIVTCLLINAVKKQECGHGKGRGWCQKEEKKWN